MMALSLALMTNTALAYNTFGHQTIAALADKYLTDKAKSEVNAILKSSMVQESVWLNTLRSQPEYAATKDWHIFTLDSNGKATTMAENDGVVQLEKAVDVLRNRTNHTDSLVQASLRTVIHLVGDMHCLSHIHIDGIEATKGFKFKRWNEQEGKDSKIIDVSWYYMWEGYFSNRYAFFTPAYYADDIDIYANDKKAEYEKGTVRFWVENGGEDVVRALAKFNTGEKVRLQEVLQHEYNHTKCMAKAGYRLAALLNDIFK